MTKREVRNRILFVIDFEPSWHTEFGAGLGMLLWSVFAFFTDDLRVTGTDYLLPFVGVAFGPLRWVLLFQVVPAPRAGASAIGAAVFAWIGCGLAGHYGVVPLLGFIIAFFVMEVLTICRFSSRALGALMAEWNGGGE
jgi:hypothetical protein